jgi:hypothetical protein
MEDLLGLALDNQVAIEERADGVHKKEVELVFYARLAEPIVLPETSDRERQEQWTIKIGHTDKNGGRGDIRVRKTDFFDAGDSGRTEYVLTTKIRNEGGLDDEIPIPSTADQFEHFKTLAESGMYKDRYTYPINGTELKWEVDVYLKPDGGYYPWVKIDLEVKSKDAPVPEFPFEAEEWIKGQNGERSAEEEAKLRNLYETIFLLPNPASKAHKVKADATDEQDDAVPEHPVVQTAEVSDQTPATENLTEPAKGTWAYLLKKAKPALEAQKEFTGDWPELDGKPVTPDMTPGAEIFEGKDGQVRSEPDENRPVEGTEAALEVIQEFSNKVEQLAQDMNVRLLHLSLGQGYVSPESLYAQLAQKAPEKVPVAQGGPFGAQYYYVKNPAEGAIVGGIGWHFNHPTLSSDQVQF